MTLTRSEEKLLYKALCSAFSVASISRFIYFDLEDKVQNFSTERELSAICFSLIRIATQEGWIDQLAERAIREVPRNREMQEFAREIDSKLATNEDPRVPSAEVSDESLEGDQVTTQADTNDPLLLVEDFKKDIEKVPRDQWWDATDFERELTTLRLRLPHMREYMRSLWNYRPRSSYEAFLRELSLRDAANRASSLLDDLEVCLGYLLDLDAEAPSSAATRYVQWYRRTSEQLSTALDKLSAAAEAREAGLVAPPEQTKHASEPSMFKAVLEDLRAFRGVATHTVEEWQLLLTAPSSPVKATLGAIVSYLREAREPTIENLEAIRAVVVELTALADYVVAMQKRVPATVRTSSPPLPPAEARRLRRMCDETVDRVDYYIALRDRVGQYSEVSSQGDDHGRMPTPSVIAARRAFVRAFLEMQRHMSSFSIT